MKSKAIKNINFLNLLSDYSKNSPRQFKTLLENSSKHELKAVSEIIINILNGHLKSDSFKKLRRHRNILRKIGDLKYPDSKKIYIIEKRSGVPVASIKCRHTSPVATI